MPDRVINEQTIFYFKREEVERVLFAAVKDRVPGGNWYVGNVHVSAGMTGDGLTLCCQRRLTEHNAPTA